jgi:hypothetical protein
MQVEAKIVGREVKNYVDKLEEFKSLTVLIPKGC